MQEKSGQREREIKKRIIQERDILDGLFNIF